MKPLYLRLKGSRGIKSGLSLNEISIDFTQFASGIIAIQGQNGSGKSTIMKSCHPYAMVTGSKKKIQEHFFMRDSEKEFICEQDGIKYRSLFLIDSQSEKMEAYLYRYTDKGEQEPLNNGLLTSYKEVAEKIFGSEEIFVNVLNSSRKLTPITQMLPAKRKEIFYYYLGSKLTVFEKLDAIAKGRYDSAQKELESSRTRIAFIDEKLSGTMSIAEMNIKQSETETSKSKSLEKLESIKAKIQQAESELLKENHKLSLVDETEKKIAELEQSKKQIEITMESETASYTLEQNQLDIKKSELESEISRKDKILANKERIEQAISEITTLKEFLEKEIPAAKVKKAEIEKEVSRLTLEYNTRLNAYNASVSEITTRYEREIAELDKDYAQKESEYKIKLSETKAQKERIENKYFKLIDAEEKEYAARYSEYSENRNVVLQLEKVKENIVEILRPSAQKLYETEYSSWLDRLKRARKESSQISTVPCTQHKECVDACEFLANARQSNSEIPLIEKKIQTLSDEYKKTLEKFDLDIKTKEEEIRVADEKVKEPDRATVDATIKKLEAQRNDELSEVLDPQEPDKGLHEANKEALRQKASKEQSELEQPTAPDTFESDMEISKLENTTIFETEKRRRLDILEQQGWSKIQQEYAEALVVLPEKKKALSEIEKQIQESTDRYSKNGAASLLRSSSLKLQIEQLKKEADRATILLIINSWNTKKQELSQTKSFTENDIKNYDEDLLNIKSQLQTIENYLAEKQKEESELSKIERKVERLAFIREGLSKNGIPALIIHNVGLDVAEIANEYLKDGDSGLRINFDTLRPTKNGSYKESFEIGIRRGEDQIDIQDLSDGETCWIDESISKAIGEYLTDKSRFSTHKYDSDFTDEKDGSLSPENKHIFLELMEKSRIRSNRYYSFMVSHSPSIWKTIPQRIHLSKEEGITIVN
jgi:DNA repair exonuclease SbcCD ATPase subunit